MGLSKTEGGLFDDHSIESLLSTRSDPLAQPANNPIDCSHDEVLVERVEEGSEPGQVEGSQSIFSGKTYPFVLTNNYLKPFWSNGTIKNAEEVVSEAVEATATTEGKLDPNKPSEDTGKCALLRERCDEWIEKARSAFVSHQSSAMQTLSTLKQKLPSLSKVEAKAYLSVLLLLSGVCGMYAYGLARSQSGTSPKGDLRDFVLYEKANNGIDLQSIEDLDTDLFETYARASCVEGASVNSTRDALFIGLKGIPEVVRE
jgi:hypothetical protein